MALSVSEPATLFEMAELGGAGTWLAWAVVKEMWRGGETFALRDGDQLIGLFGLYRTEGGAEAWFNVAPGAAAHMPEIIRRIRLTLVSRDYPEIVVLCTSNVGSRIARLCGFNFVQTDENGEIWHGKFAGGQLGLRPCKAAGRATAAQDAGGTVAPAGRDGPGCSRCRRPEDGRPHADLPDRAFR